MTATTSTPDTTTSTPRAATFALLALALGGFTLGTTEFASMGLVPDIASDLGVSIPATGHVITAYALGVVVGAPVLTSLAARLPRKALLLWLMAGYSAANLASAFVPGLGGLLVARFVAGLPHGAFFGVGAVVGTAVVGPARRGRAVATMMAGLTVANVVGVPLSTFVGQRLGWRLAFVLVGGLGVLALLGLARFVPSVAPLPGASVRGELGALRNGRLWVTAVAAAVGFGGLFAVYTYVAPTVTTVTGLPDDAVPVVLAVFGVGMTLGTVVGGRLVDRDVLRTVVGGFAATAVALVALALVLRWPLGAFAGLFLLAATSQVLGVAMQTRLMDLAPTAPSLGAALSHSALNVGNANGAFVGGLVISAGWGYGAPAWAGVLLTLAGLAIVLLAGRGTRRAFRDTSQPEPVACAASSPREA